MPTKAYAVRIPPPLKQAVDARAEREKLNTTNAILAALEDWAGGEESETSRRLAARIETLEAALEGARSELARAQVQLAPFRTRLLGSEAEEAFAGVLQNATPGNPATQSLLRKVTGWGTARTERHLTALRVTGYVSRIAKGCYVAADGRSVLEGMAAIRGRVIQLNQDASQAREAVPAQSPAPEPPVPSTARREPPAPRSVPRARKATVGELKDRVPGLVSASDLAAPSPVFRAGPDVDCVHENMRIAKGVCPDCKQWVTR